MPLIAAIDQGTTSTRAVITDTEGRVVAQAQFEHIQHMPREGWVEHDPMEIWRNTRRALSEAMAEADIAEDDIGALGLTNQRETAVIWDKATGAPIYNAIVWQDTRTNPESDADPGRYLERTGLLHNSYPAGPKWAWILDNVDGARERAERGELLAGTIDTWLIWNLTGGAREPERALHVTDVTNASRTLLMDLRTLAWDEDLCAEIGVPRRLLPEIRASIGTSGTVRRRGPLAGVPIAGVLGDQQAALFGQHCLRENEAKMTYGTGLFMLLNTGAQPRISSDGLLTTVAYQIDGEPPVYAQEGSVAVGGSLIQWLRDQLGILRTAEESERLAAQVDNSGGVVIVPAFSGLFAPRWRPDARGVITGLTRFVDRRHIARAALEATCLQALEVVRAMGGEPTELRVDGGMTTNDLLMQMQADILGLRVERPANTETTVMGAASAAGIGAKLICAPLSLGPTTAWENTWAGPERDRLVARWEDAVRRSYDQA
ncbi:glycerol kinase GlpK [Corynebacterium godavarianum]|uniref:ATP:glycerol 3-phosphotransferase n=1 Tax=Corynebacterium godavarianum TaxID=2054421 RepID=A0ABY3E2A0_9CORY|nr:glycerol kinase GlpK [Corynebacterium godavarianum]MBL7286832.1 glycerol kinase GlpK [Corynebacterium godavarianum]TSJ73739.1 glycerol kinase GlpK [Corynebacterium godavarianum]